MEESPAKLHKFTALRLIPRLREFEGKQGETKFFIAQLRRWLIRFDDMFDEVGYDTKTRDWKDQDRCACDQEYEQRTTLIKWSRALDPEFDYDVHKKSMDFFRFLDNIIFNDHEVHTALDEEEELEEERQKEEKNDDDWNTFKQHRQVIIRNFCDFNNKMIKKCLLEMKVTSMSDLWKEELTEFWEEGDYDEKKQILEFHGRLFCRNLNDYE